MRLTRLAAVGLAIGIIAGFAIALLRPRPHVQSMEDHDDLSVDRAEAGSVTDEQMWEKFRKAEAAPAVELRASRQVNG